MTQRGLVVALLVIVVTGFVAPVAGVSSTRTSVSGPPPVVVFQGEEINVSQVGRTGGGVVGMDPLTLTGLAGDAEGGIESIEDPGDADFDNVETGTYDVDSDEKPEFAVVRPRITKLTLRLDNGANVTGGQIPSSRTVTVHPEFNFASADGVRIRVFDETETDITPELTDDPIVAENGGSLTLDFSGEDEGRFRIVAEHRTEEDDVSVRRSLTVGSEDLSINLDKASVTQGERVTATVMGSPGELAHVRIDESDLETDSVTTDVAERVFRSTSDVTDIVGDSDRGVVAAVVRIDDSGRARVQIDTDRLDTGTASIEVAAGEDLSARTEDEIDLRVGDRSIAATVPTVLEIGTKHRISGSAPRADTVKAYAYVDGRWEPLLADGARNRYAEDDVGSDGRFELTVDTSRVVNYPDSYRITIVADAVDRYPSDRVLSGSDLNDLTKTTTSVRTTAGSLTVAQSRSVVATGSGDEVIVYGTAFGQGDDLHLYAVSPRGQLHVAQTIPIDQDGEFEEAVDGFDQRGTYEIVVVGQGRDGRFHNGATPGSVRSRLAGGEDQSQVIAVLRDAYLGAGSDDQFVERSLQAESPSIVIDAIGSEDRLPASPDRLTLSGRSNRAPGTVVEVSVEEQEGGSTLTTAEAQVRTDGSWATTIDGIDIENGQYVVRVDDGESTASRSFAVGEALSTATPTEADTPSEEPTPTERPSPTETDRPGAETPTPDTVTDTETATPTSAPGFGVVLAVLAILAAIVARRQ
jgi:PGF-CTERM protein